MKMIFRKGLFLFALGCAISTANTNAQIITTTITPAGMPGNGGFDFNKDAVNEIDIDAYGVLSYNWTNGGTNIWANGTAASGWDVPKPLTAGTTIDASGNFVGNGDASMDDWGGTTPFPNGTDAYIGTRLKIGTAIYYGWIRVMWNGSVFIFKDYAYESTPNKAIKAGAKTTTSVYNVAANNTIQLYPNPAKNTITLTSSAKMTTALVYDMSGALVKTFSLNNTGTSTIDIATLPAGRYALRIFGNTIPVGYTTFVVLP